MRLPALQKVEVLHKSLISQILSKMVRRNLSKLDSQKKRYYPISYRR
ncbi:MULTISPECIES: hypothetical protein [Rummeliibacillus]|jgi:hypothetical protein|nr:MULTISPECIES: hypothetical protein [Rummeliibacillus]